MGKSFQEQVEESLSGFSRENVCFFAWLCAVRALPFLAVSGNFNYWKSSEHEDQRQKHLFAILHALDNAAHYATDSSFSPSARHASALASDVASATRTPYSASSADLYAASAAASTASAAASAASAAASSYARRPFAVASTVSATAFAALAADSAYSAVVSADDGTYRLHLRDIMLADLQILQTKTEDRKFQNDTAIYGQIWNRFQRVLRDLGCGYWGEWYARVFAKGFILDDKDREEIKRRLSVPGEIMERGAADVVRYVLELKEFGAVRLNEARVIILGNKGAGKTSLARRLQDPDHTMPKDEESTEGVDIIDWTIPADPPRLDSGVNVHIWDFAGHVITHAVHPCFMFERCLYILVVDGRTENSRTEYWLEQIRNYGGKDSPVLVLVNVRDDHCVDLPKNTLEKEFPSIKGFYEANIRARDEQFKYFRHVVMRFLRDKPSWNKKISVPAYKVKEALRQKFVEGNHFIERDVFNQIARYNGIKPEDQQQLLTDLRDLGICLWYGDADMGEFSTMVLNPSWISHGIYRLINWGSNKKKDTLSVSDFCEVFKDDAVRYPTGQAAFLFELMKTYKLAFSNNALEIFVPLLRPADRPKTGLPVFRFGERLRMEYSASQALPPYTVARLAVQHSGEWDKERSWRFGAVLSWDGTEALVEESEHARSVTVYVKGPKQTEYISKLRATLDGIFNDYKNSLQPELKFEVLLTDELRNQVNTFKQSDYDKLLYPADLILGNADAGQDLFIPHLKSMVPPRATVAAYYDFSHHEYHEQRNVTVKSNGTYEEVRGDKVYQLTLPDSLTDIQWSEFLAFITQFLESKEAKKLTVGDSEKIQEELKNAKKMDAKLGWSKIREFLSDGANVTTILTPIAKFLTANSDQIAQWIQHIF